MEGYNGGDDGCHLNIDESCQPRGVSKNLKKDDNLELKEMGEGGPSHEEIDIDEGINPFEIQVILDVVFKMLSFEDVKKFRLVSYTWNEVGTSELSKKPQKPIKVEELGQNDNLGSLIKLQRRHNELFPHDHHHQLFSYFAINISTLMLKLMELDQFFDQFSPKLVEFYGSCHISQDSEKVRKLQEFLIKTSPTVQELLFNFDDHSNGEQGSQNDFVQELTSTLFPNLRKISHKIRYSDLKKLSIYSLIGQNSPKLHHLELGSINTKSLGSPGYMKEQFEQSGLMSKLQILDLVPSGKDFDGDFVKIFTGFGRKGVLKLTALKIEQNVSLPAEKFKEIFAPLIASQAETLKILEILENPTIPSPYLPTYRINEFEFRVPFPSLQNLSILQIDNFSSFKQYFEPINFGLQFPKLVEFKTNNIGSFLYHNLGHDGSSVKSVTIFKNPDALTNRYHRGSDYSSQITDYDYKGDLNLVLLHQIFPNLEFLELDLLNLKILVPFWSELKKVVIHAEPQDLYYLRKKVLQDAESVELLVDCESILRDKDSHKDFFARLMRFHDWVSVKEDLDQNSRDIYYQQFLDKISDQFSSLHTVSVTFIGQSQNISEDFKRDFGAILPHSEFICTQVKSNDADPVLLQVSKTKAELLYNRICRKIGSFYDFLFST